MSTTNRSPGFCAEVIKQATCNPTTRPESHNLKLQCLARSPLFVGFSAAQYGEAASAAQLCSYSEDETVFLQDDRVKRVLVVASGAVKITRLNESGNETLLRLEHEGDWLDDTCGHPQVHSVCARTTEQSVLLAWDTATFEALSTRIPTIERNMVRVMRTRLQTLQDRFCDVSTLRVPQRLARAILRLGSGAGKSISLSREEIGQMTGTSMFTVCRVLSSWADAEIVTLDRGRIFVEDADRLRDLAQAA